MSSDITTFLFARPNFLEGMARTIDLFGLLSRQYNRSRTPEQADARAIKSDWLAVGEDFWRAIEQFEDEQQAVEATTPR
jgi:hypothetical protein